MDALVLIEVDSDDDPSASHAPTDPVVPTEVDSDDDEPDVDDFSSIALAQQSQSLPEGRSYVCISGSIRAFARWS